LKKSLIFLKGNTEPIGTSIGRKPAMLFKNANSVVLQPITAGLNKLLNTFKKYSRLPS
jgi:hypothetical protein